MPLRLPKANTWFQHQTDPNLATYAQTIHDGLLASIATFPTPPIAAATIQTQINSYVTALSLATGPGAGKINTANKNKQKVLLQSYLRQNARYVNQIIVGIVSSGGTYEAVQATIIATGYQLSADPSPAGPLPGPDFIKYGSYSPGQFYMLVTRVPNARGYEVLISDGITGDYITSMSFATTRITINGLTSGKSYNFSVASIGSNPTRNYDNTLSGAIVI